MLTQSVSLPKLGYSIAEAALVTGLSRASLYRAVARGELTLRKVGRRSIVPAESLEALCRVREEDAA